MKRFPLIKLEGIPCFYQKGTLVEKSKTVLDLSCVCDFNSVFHATHWTYLEENVLVGHKQPKRALVLKALESGVEYIGRDRGKHTAEEDHPSWNPSKYLFICNSLIFFIFFYIFWALLQTQSANWCWNSNLFCQFSQEILIFLYRKKKNNGQRFYMKWKTNNGSSNMELLPGQRRGRGRSSSHDHYLQTQPTASATVLFHSTILSIKPFFLLCNCRQL